MKRLGIVCVAVCLFVSPALAQVPQKILDDMQYLVGNWETEGTFEGKPSKGTFSAHWVPGKHCLTLAGRNPDLSFSGISGWDPATGNIVETWHRSDGVLVEIRYAEITPSTWKGTVKLTNAAGKVLTGKCQLDKTADGFTFTGAAGDLTASTKNRRLHVSEKPAHVARWLKFLQGSWSSQWSGANLNLDGENEIRLVGDHTLLVTGSSGDGPTAEIIGWRADTQRIVMNGYGAKNGYWHAEYGDLHDDRLRGTVSGLLADGRAVSGSIELKKIDDNHYEVRFDGTAAGSPLPLTAKLTRKKK